MEFRKIARFACNGLLDLVEVDMISAFVQLRVADAGNNVAMPSCRRLLSFEDVNAELERLSDGNLPGAKKALKGVTNLAAEQTVPLHTLPARCADFLKSVKQEMQEYIAWSLSRHPGLVEDFLHRPHPELSAHAVIDEHHETKVMAPVIQAFRSRASQGRYFVAPCHDGLDVPRQGVSDSNLIRIAVEAGNVFKFSVKLYIPFADYARQKWPEEDWGHRSKVPAVEYFGCSKVMRDCGTH